MKKRLLLLIILICLAGILFAETGLRIKAVNWLAAHNVSQDWIIIIISMLPVIELRGSIPVGILLFRMNWIRVVALSIFGNMLPIPIVLLFLDAVVSVIRKTAIGRRLTDWLFKRTRNKGKVIEQYEYLGLAVFVGIPLPGTGAWTGSFAAKIFGLRFWKSLGFIFIGVLIAATAVTLLCQMGLIAFQ